MIDGKKPFEIKQPGISIRIRDVPSGEYTSRLWPERGKKSDWDREYKADSDGRDNRAKEGFNGSPPLFYPASFYVSSSPNVTPLSSVSPLSEKVQMQPVVTDYPKTANEAVLRAAIGNWHGKGYLLFVMQSPIAEYLTVGKYLLPKENALSVRLGDGTFYFDRAEIFVDPCKALSKVYDLEVLTRARTLKTEEHDLVMEGLNLHWLNSALCSYLKQPQQVQLE